MFVWRCASRTRHTFINGVDEFGQTPAVSAATNRIPLESHPLFEGVKVPDLSTGGLRLRPRTAARGAIVCGPGMPPSLVLVLGGNLHTFLLTPDGRQRLLLEILVPGDLDGMLAMSGLTEHLCEAATQSEIVVLSAIELDRLTAIAPRITRNLYELAIRRIARHEGHMAALSETSALRAIARQLLSVAAYAGDHVDGCVVMQPRFTHQLLAEMLGLRRETITLGLKTLRHLGVVRFAGNRMLVDERKLVHVVGGPAGFNAQIDRRMTDIA